MSVGSARVGFIGLGNMGLPIAHNVARGGYTVLGYDVAARSRWASAPLEPRGSVAEVAQEAEQVLLSLPDAAAVGQALKELIGAPRRVVRQVIDLSTIGVTAAREFAARAQEAGIAYVDAPVSGGVAGARARTISVMCACAPQEFESAQPVLNALSQRVFHVGQSPGQGQALKLLNNFLSATALAATSEAVLLGLAHGLQMETILDVLKVSSGRNSAVDDKFPNHVATGRYEGGFRNTLMSKDMDLFLRETQAAGCQGEVGRVVGQLWREFKERMPDQDFTRIFEFLQHGQKSA